jgi:hypothetical protein
MKNKTQKNLLLAIPSKDNAIKIYTEQGELRRYPIINSIDHRKIKTKQKTVHYMDDNANIITMNIDKESHIATLYDTELCEFFTDVKNKLEKQVKNLEKKANQKERINNRKEKIECIEEYLNKRFPSFNKSYKETQPFSELKPMLLDYA